MSKSIIRVANTSTQSVAPTTNSPAIVSLGNVIRRYGDNLRLNGTAIEECGNGYYTISGSITVAPTAAGIVTVGVFENGESMPGSIVLGSVTTAGNPVTLPLSATSRIKSCCNCSSISVGVIAGAGTVPNVTVEIDKL